MNAFQTAAVKKVFEKKADKVSMRRPQQIATAAYLASTTCRGQYFCHEEGLRIKKQNRWSTAGRT